MIRLTPFRVATDAFAFDNSWPIDGWELNEIRRFLAREHGRAIRALANSGFAHALVRTIHAQHLLEDVLRDEHITRYGLCGGMTFAALDYYRQGWVVPQGRGADDHPRHDDAAGRALRNYIWLRLLDSMQSRAARTMLAWSLALHLVPRLGPAWLLAQSLKEWETLKRRLDAGEPWPLGLVGAAHGSFANHQVLAIGYDDPGDGRGTIVVYDSTCPGQAHTLALDFRGPGLGVDESCARGGGDTQWSGFFCNVYTPARPPIAVGLSERLTASPASGASGDDTVRVRYSARNYSFSHCPPLALRVCDRAPDRAADGSERPGEAEPAPLGPGASRALDISVARDGTAEAEHFSACCYLGSADGLEVWKRLPAHPRS